MAIRRNLGPVNFDRDALVAAREELRNDIFKLFSDPLPREVTRYVSRQVGRAAERRGELPPDIAEQVLADMDLSAWQPLIPKAERALSTASREASQIAMWRIGIPEEDSLSQSAKQFSEQWASNRAAEMVGMKRSDSGKLVANPNPKMAISETTRGMLRATVDRAIRQEWSADRLAEEIRQTHAFSAARAENIARTEIGMATNRGAIIAYKTSGIVVGTRWITMRDYRVDPECRDNASVGMVAIDAEYPSGHKHPPAHSRCRCRLGVVTESGDTREEEFDA